MKKVLILAAIASFLMTSVAFAYETKSAADSSYTEVQKKHHRKHHKKVHKAPHHEHAPMAQ